MKLALVNLAPLKEGSMQARELADRNSLEQLQAMRDEIFMDMEKDPSIEPEGGEVADQYGDRLNDIDAAIQIKNPFEKGSVGGMTYDDMLKKHYPDKYGERTTIAPDKDTFTKSSKFDRMNESTEKSWNAIDVSRKAEKEIDNKEWNERTAKKLDMLIALNKAGKFKKDWDEEKLQGWVDQNYSWEKLARQFKLNESYLSMYETMQQGDYSAIEQGWDGLSFDEQRDIINTALDGEARPDDFEKDFDQLKSEIPDFESGVANYLGIDEGEDFRLEPEDMDNPDEDLVIIGSGYLDIKSNFGERPSQTNGEYAALGQKVVDQLHNGDKEAALNYIYSKINEVDEGLGTSALQVTDQNGVVAVIEDPKDIEAYDRGNTVIGVTADGKKIELNVDWSEESHMTANEGSCGYSQEAPGGEELDTPGGTQGMDADDRTRTMLKKLIQKEVKKLTVGKPPITKEGKPGDFDKGLEDLMGKDDFEKATSNEVPGLGDTVIDDKTDISTGKKTFMKMMTQFTDEPFLIETGLKLYDAWARGEGGLKPSRILKILQDTKN